MGRSLTICGMMMAAGVALLSWLQPASYMMSFAAADGQLAVIRWAIVAVLAGLLVADIYTDHWSVRWTAGLLSLVLAYDATRILVDNSVYMLDFLIVAMAAVSSAIVALQPRSEPRALPTVPNLVDHRVPVRLPVVSIYERLARPIRQGRRSIPSFMMMNRAQDIEDDSHRMAVSYRP